MKGQGKRFIRGLARGKEGDCTWGAPGGPAPRVPFSFS